MQNKAGLRGAQLPRGVAGGEKQADATPREPLNGASGADLWPCTSGRRRLRQQSSQAHQVVGGAGEGEQGAHLGLLQDAGRLG